MAVVHLPLPIPGSNQSFLIRKVPRASDDQFRALARRHRESGHGSEEGMEGLEACLVTKFVTES